MFCATYPGEFQRGDISWPWFQYLLKYTPNVRAMQKLADAEAMSVVVSSLGDSDAAKKGYKKIREEAFRDD